MAIFVVAAAALFTFVSVAFREWGFATTFLGITVTNLLFALDSLKYWRPEVSA